ncbi:MAG: Cytochrome c oxidase (cbb3-type) subunit CcoO [Burkholderiaceae bacterium]|jgi:cytochrome c oxidase cbb3-type subunit 2|nr:MAG: Cytochrome c oxidase (cbb3-type) subunit CcoO [Burkholderiaceae bacterium]
MKSETTLIGGAMVTMALSVSALVILPMMDLQNVTPTPGLKPYSSAELRGRQVYISNGCVYCHTQQPRTKEFAAADFKRGWGRATVAGDYAYDSPPLLGDMRTGPDLMNIGVRQPSEQWNLGHLYEPRAYVPGSIMPAFPFLFEAKTQADKDEVVVTLPPGYAPPGKVVVARPEAVDLVKYLLSLNRSFPAIETPPAANAPATPAAASAKN